MKTLQINDNQKKKLDKLIEYYLKYNIDYKYLEFKNNFIILSIETDNNKNIIEIHWFEFLVTKIALIILGYNTQLFGNLCTSFFSKKSHPIDYLYSKYVNTITKL